MKKFLIIIFIIAINNNNIHSTVTLTDKQDLLEAKEVKEHVRQSSLSELKENKARNSNPKSTNKKKTNDISTQTEIQSEWEKIYQNIKKGHALPIGLAIVTGLVTGGVDGVIEKKIGIYSSLFSLIPWYVERSIRSAILTDLKNNTHQGNQLKESMESCSKIASWLGYFLIAPIRSNLERSEGQ